MSLAVVLLNWNAAQRTIDCASKVRRWTTLQPSLVVVDNYSDVRDYERLARAISPDELIRTDANLGFAGGNNVGIQRAIGLDAEFILLLNTDVEISEAGIVRLLDALSGDDSIQVIGPCLKECGGNQERIYCGGREIGRYLRTRVPAPPDSDSRHAPRIEAVDYVPGTVFLTRSQAFKTLGLLDERYFFSGEIADFCKRVNDRGSRCCVHAGVAALHDLDQTASNLRSSLYAYYSLRNRFLYVSKYCGVAKPWYIALWLQRGLVRLVAAICRLRFAKARAIALALLHGVFHRFGNQNRRFKIVR